MISWAWRTTPASLPHAARSATAAGRALTAWCWLSELAAMPRSASGWPAPHRGPGSPPYAEPSPRRCRRTCAPTIRWARRSGGWALVDGLGAGWRPTVRTGRHWPDACAPPAVRHAPWSIPGPMSESSTQHAIVLAAAPTARPPGTTGGTRLDLHSRALR
ncbi:hypothetical protein HBB16_01990 [Pseudonocardia sp. MCCB 268]|nr:hypothetical protein [Pseudonocardia cytotoxica]